MVYGSSEAEMKKRSTFFEKQAADVKIVSAAWVADKGRPDHPSFWNTCLFTMSDGSRYRVKREKLDGHDWKW